VCQLPKHLSHWTCATTRILAGRNRKIRVQLMGGNPFLEANHWPTKDEILLPKKACFFHTDRQSWPAMTSIAMANWPIKCFTNDSLVVAQLVWARSPPSPKTRQSHNWRSPFWESSQVVAVVTLNAEGITWWPAFKRLLIDGCITAKNYRTDTSVLGNQKKGLQIFILLKTSGKNSESNCW